MQIIILRQFFMLKSRIAIRKTSFSLTFSYPCSLTSAVEPAQVKDAAIFKIIMCCRFISINCSPLSPVHKQSKKIFYPPNEFSWIIYKINDVFFSLEQCV
ncbi:hypothetical protein CS542_05920 [Pedobacter sp. IW39]|nr:hypothetical protein CS542_05920 [Pedobacter sp. IW39]